MGNCHPAAAWTNFNIYLLGIILWTGAAWTAFSIFLLFLFSTTSQWCSAWSVTRCESVGQCSNPGPRCGMHAAHPTGAHPPRRTGRKRGAWRNLGKENCRNSVTLPLGVKGSCPLLPVQQRWATRPCVAKAFAPNLAVTFTYLFYHTKSTKSVVSFFPW